MISLTWDLLPVLLGVIASPLAVMALVAVLLSARARRNGPLYLLGWSLAVGIAVLAAYGLLGLADGTGRADHPAPWVPFARLVLGVLLGVAAVWTHRRSRAKLALMAAATTPEEVTAAAPQLPGWLRSVESFTPGRSFALGLGIFLLNPVNMSCAIIAALDVRLADLSAPAPAVFLTVFIVLSIVPMAVPVLLVLRLGSAAAPVLDRIRSWIAAHNGTLSAVMLAIVGFGQIQKALAALPWV
ncbi:MAG: GAP family protein [Actinobacteria bacterium]|nr:GAP family protein [Actinomycetota bacterium]